MKKTAKRVAGQTAQELMAMVFTPRVERAAKTGEFKYKNPDAPATFPQKIALQKIARKEKRDFDFKGCALTMAQAGVIIDYGHKQYPDIWKPAAKNVGFQR